jgi:hypothetical protein
MPACSDGYVDPQPLASRIRVVKVLPKNTDQLHQYITEQMRMSHVYQPVT